MGGIGSLLYRYRFAPIANEDIERIVGGVVLPNPAFVMLHERFGLRWAGTFSAVGGKLGQYWDMAGFERLRDLPGSAPWPRPAPQPSAGNLAERGERGRIRLGR